MDWNKAERILKEISMVYNRDNIRKIAYNKEVSPLVFRYGRGERTPELYRTIFNVYKELIYNPSIEETEEGVE
jgi:hypothetical protein